jgi:hypothetical protein
MEGIILLYRKMGIREMGNDLCVMFNTHETRKGDIEENPWRESYFCIERHPLGGKCIDKTC